MAKKRNATKDMSKCDHSHYYGKKKMLMGCMVFLFGLLVYWGYTWDIALMVVGALMFLKGMWIKMGKKCC